MPKLTAKLAVRICIEYPFRDWLSFMCFLGLQLESKVPDAKTVWLFREHLKELNLMEAWKRCLIVSTSNWHNVAMWLCGYVAMWRVRDTCPQVIWLDK